MDTLKAGKFLQDLRIEHNLTQEELGEKLGVTNKTISRWETGTYIPPVDILIRLSEIYNVTVNEILSGERLAIADYQPKAEENIVATLKKSQKLSRWQKALIACGSVVLALILLFLAFFLWLYFGFQFNHKGQFVAGTYEYQGEPFLIANGDMIESIELTFKQIDEETFKAAKVINVIKNGANKRMYAVDFSVKLVGGEVEKYNVMFYGSSHADSYDFLVDSDNSSIRFSHIEIGVWSGLVDEYNVVRSISFVFNIRDYDGYNSVEGARWDVNLKLRNDTPNYYEYDRY